MADPRLDIETRDAVQIWTLNHPETGNAITDQKFIESFEAAVDAANANLEVRAIVLTGAGKIFSSGGNVKEMADKEGMFGGDPRQMRQSYTSGIQRIPRAIARLEVPLIGAINGAAVGAGNDLAVMCDMRVASERASFAESFVQVGIIPGDGGSWFLPQVIGYEKAAWMSFTGDRIDAQKAFDWGLVGEVVPHEELMDKALELAARVTKNPSHALRMAKRLLHESRTASLDALLAMAAAMQPLAHLDPEHEQRIERWKTK